jgi:hypothetical protein
MVQPVAQAPAAHGGGRAVEQREERGRFRPADRLGDLQVAARGRVHEHELALALDVQAGNVRQRGLLGVAAIREERARRRDGGVHAFAAIARKVVGAELLREVAACAIRVELPGLQALHRHAATQHHFNALGEQDFRRRKPFQLGCEALARHFGDDEPAARECDPREARGPARDIHGGEVAFARGREERRVGEGAGSDHARDLAIDRALRGRRIAHLLADCDRFAQLHQLGEVLLEGVERNARHADRRTRRLAPRGERDVEQLRRALRVGVEHLVEVAHAVEQQHVGIPRLQREVLLHHRGVGGGAVERHRQGEEKKRGRENAPPSIIPPGGLLDRVLPGLDHGTWNSLVAGPVAWICIESSFTGTDLPSLPM